MPDSMFGRPSQDLLPSYPSANARDGSVASNPPTAPVQPAAVSFKDFRFHSIGKQPELLSRISFSQPDHADYHSSPSSPTSTPLPTSTNNDILPSKPFSRPTLLQQLAGSAYSSSMEEGLRRDASTSQSNCSLASRIQMNGSPANDVVSTAPNTTSGFPSFFSSRVNLIRRPTEDSSLIPPVEVLTQQPDSSLSTPLSMTPVPQSVVVQSPTSSAPLMDMTAIRSSRIPTPPSISTDIASKEPMEPLPSPAVVDATVQEPQPSPSAAAAPDPLVVRQERLRAISANLANLVSPLPPPLSQSSSPPSSVLQVNDDIIPRQSSRSQHSYVSMVPRHPSLVNQPSSRVELSINHTLMNMSDSSLAPVHSPTTITQDNQTRHKTLIEAIQSLDSALNVVHRAQIDSENALAFQIRAFEEQRAAFDQTKRAEEATLQKLFQELQRKDEELYAREASLASLEQESKTREVARKVMLANRQTQEEEKRAAEAKRMQEVQEQIAAAMTELKEFETLRANNQLGQLANGTLPDDLPVEIQEGMNEEEKTVIKSRDDILIAVKHLRRMHSDKMQKLEESNRTLRRLEEERKQRKTEEAERRRIVEEERSRAHAEAERARQDLDEKQRRLEAERKRQAVENDRGQARLSVEQQANADVQARDLRRKEAASGQIIEYLDLSERASPSQQQDIADMTRIRVAPEANFLPSEVTTATNVDEDGKAFAPHRAVPLPGIHARPGGSQNATPQPKQKKDISISGDVIPATSTPKASAGPLPPKPSANSSLSTSDCVAENTVNPAPIVVPAEDGHGSSFPARFASKFNRVVNAKTSQTLDHKPDFSRTPKPRTFLEATIGGSEEFNIGPVIGVSPTQQNVNLRHLKRSRSRIDENDSGDRSVRVNVKNEEITSVSLKEEEHVPSYQLMEASLSTNRPAVLPPRPVIPPPRPQKHRAPVSHIDLTRSCPSESNESSSTKGQVVSTDEQPREAFSRGSSSSQAMNAPVQPPASAETAHSLPSGPVFLEPQPPEPRSNVGERPTQSRAEKYNTASSGLASVTLFHGVDGEDPSRSNRKFTDEHRRTRDGNNSRRLTDHHSPSFVMSRSTAASSTQPNHLIDSRRLQYPSTEPRGETIHAAPPTTGRKRSFEFDDNEHGHRARRQRGDVRMAQNLDRDRVDSYRPHQDRRSDSEPDERWAPYRAPTPPHDWTRSYASDIPRATDDNKTHIPPLSEAPSTLVARWEQSNRRSENDDTYQYNPVAAQHHADDVRVNRKYEPMEIRMDVQPDPSLLARISNTQRFSPPTNLRGRGGGEPNRGRGDFGRGHRGRGGVRGGPALLDRLTSGPSLSDRLS